MGTELAPMTQRWASVLAPELAAIDPWARLGSTTERLMAGLTRADDPLLRCRCLLVDGKLAGAMAVRSDWLLGPYLLHLSVLPAFQRQGAGRWMLREFETEARRAKARNLWVCGSAFNAPALALYQSQGFVRVGLLDDLIVDGLDEVLLRKRLIGSAAPGVTPRA
jgi:diamine N-acetyltransferase